MSSPPRWPRSSTGLAITRCSPPSATPSGAARRSACSSFSSPSPGSSARQPAGWRWPMAVRGSPSAPQERCNSGDHAAHRLRHSAGGARRSARRVPCRATRRLGVRRRRLDLQRRRLGLEPCRLPGARRALRRIWRPACRRRAGPARSAGWPSGARLTPVARPGGMDQRPRARAATLTAKSLCGG